MPERKHIFLKKDQSRTYGICIVIGFRTIREYKSTGLLSLGWPQSMQLNNMVVFLCKVLLKMMLLLVADVVKHPLYLRLAHCECGITLLPCKFLRRQFILIDPKG